MIDVNKILAVFDNSKDYKLTKDGMTINSILDLGDYYVVSVCPKNIKLDETFEDGLFKIDKNFKSVIPFCVNDDRKKYLSALKDGIIYRRTRKIPINKE